MYAVADLIDETASYLTLSDRLPALARRAPLTFCGMSACIDATVVMGDMLPLLEAVEPLEAVAFAGMLKDRAARGVGGEVRVEWPEGPSWLSERLRPRFSLGGTGPHASWVLSTLGAPVVLNLGDRSRHMLSHIPTGVMLADRDRFVAAFSVEPHGAPRPYIFIFEYTAGVPVGEVVPKRSTRIIVRFDDPGLEHDSDFDALTRSRSASAGAALVAGFSAVADDELEGEIERVFALTGDWRAAGIPTIHLEMSGFSSAAARDRVIEASAGSGVTSIGMSHSEFAELHPGGLPADALPRAMVVLGDRLGFDRVCVHADQWAASATRNDSETEREALMAGCLLASSRAAKGHPVVPSGVDPRARFDPVPFDASLRSGEWQIVAVPSPYLERPATTLGLGDTFTAGCLLVLGSAAKGVRPDPDGT